MTIRELLDELDVAETDGVLSEASVDRLMEAMIDRAAGTVECAELSPRQRRLMKFLAVREWDTIQIVRGKNWSPGFSGPTDDDDDLEVVCHLGLAVDHGTGFAPDPWLTRKGYDWLRDYHHQTRHETRRLLAERSD